MLTLPVFWNESPAFTPKNESRQPENILSNPLKKLTQTGSQNLTIIEAITRVSSFTKSA